jgi:hypothetical protein
LMPLHTTTDSFAPDLLHSWQLSRTVTAESAPSRLPFDNNTDPSETDMIVVVPYIPVMDSYWC